MIMITRPFEDGDEVSKGREAFFQVKLKSFSINMYIYSLVVESRICLRVENIRQHMKNLGDMVPSLSNRIIYTTSISPTWKEIVEDELDI